MQPKLALRWSAIVLSMVLLSGSVFAQEGPDKKKTSKKKKPHPALLDAKLANKTAPEKFRVKFETTRGAFEMEVVRKWAPQGVDRFFNLVSIGFYDGCAFFRVIRDPRPFMCQVGINGDPKVTAAWQNAKIKDDKPVKRNKRGMVTFANAGPNTRTTQFFINFGDNQHLDAPQYGFAPFGKVVKGMSVVDELYGGYGEGAPRGKGPNQSMMTSRGNKYLKASFPKLDYIKTAEVLKD